MFGGKDNDYFVMQDGLYAWKSFPEEEAVKLSVVQGSPVSERNPHYLRVKSRQKKSGFSNKAYNGLYMRSHIKYKISFYARSVEYEGDLTVAIVKEGDILISKSIEVKPAENDGWRKWIRYEFELCTENEISDAVFVILLENSGIMEFDHFSMIPTDAVCGVFRRDLVELLKNLNPGFLRFPGGCIVEGATLANRYRFKDTLGQKEGRRYNWNRWALHENNEGNEFHSVYAHYGQTYGVGFYEYFLLCEYLGAKPLPVLNVGLACQYQSHEKVDPRSVEIKEYIQDYLDLIEFANGGTETKWGALRAEMGHEAPFGLEMIGIGNEQWEDAGSHFFERYLLFEREIHKVYPKIKLIGSAGPELDSKRFNEAWKFYQEHEDEENFVHAVDEHYYARPDWFISHTDYFDHVPRKTKILFGEYAAHSDIQTSRMPKKSAERNNLGAALAEAAFLIGMARNSDVVTMTCYAPLLARIGYVQWEPDLIWFDEKSACRTPSYYVQQMFSQNLGDYNIVAKVQKEKDLETEDIFCQVSYDAAAKELIVKLVNVSSDKKIISFDFDNIWKASDKPIKEIILTGVHKSDSNSIGKEKIKPVEGEFTWGKSYQVQPFSFSVLRIPINVVLFP